MKSNRSCLSHECKAKGLDLPQHCLHESKTRDQKRFTILEVAAD